ncbi:hypothetical protein KY321_00735 [Candidatus Woesearchaeota archaeon]|nr:hypothetical protein [Candidatus Woesearchaeota archaeon]
MTREKLSKEEREIIREAEQEAEHDELFSHDRHKKYFLHIIAGFVLIITLAYFLLSMPTFQNFLGLIESQNTDDNIFVHKNKTIVFPENILEFLQENYDKQAEHESIYCLKGNISKNQYLISSLYQPKIISQTYTNVRFEPCAQDTLIILHTHPIRECLPSKTDIDTLRNFQIKNSDAIMSIMCDVNRINFVS